MCILSVYALLKVVGYYDLSVKRFERSNGLDIALYKTILFFFLSMSVMGFQKKKFGWRMGVWGKLYPNFYGFFRIFLTLQSPLSMELYSRSM